MYVKILNKFEYCIQPNTVFLMFVFLFCFLVMFSKFLLLVVPVLVTVIPCNLFMSKLFKLEQHVRISQL